MNKRVGSIEELNKELNKIVRDALNKEHSATAMTIKQTQSDKVEEVVYEGYIADTEDGEPFVYERRRDRGGLMDTENMKHEAAISANGVKMNIVNMTPPHKDFNSNGLKGAELAHLIEEGDGAGGLRYSSDADLSFKRPRPFQAETVAELESNGRHVDALIADLDMAGIKAKKR